MNTQTLFTGWDFMRWFRLGMGIFIAIQAIQTHDSAIGFVAAFFLFQAITNTGCCGSCAVPLKEAKSVETEDVNFKEIKNK